MNEKRHSAPEGPEVGLNQGPSEGGQAAVEPETLEDLKQALAAEQEKAERYLASWQRTQADFINYRRRTEQEREETANFAHAVLMKGLFPILDDLGRALNSAPADAAAQAWAEGVKLIEHKLMAFLESQGLTPINSLAQPFDPNFHEAV
ncbi:MAG: nucleotide exchange factor GrpE, partial [Chloroflexota bacterium]|nr:nucleotide exchange factor GrpE [Chloroflexota bacterium]